MDVTKELFQKLPKDTQEFLDDLADWSQRNNTVRIYYNPKVTTGRPVYRTIEPYSLRLRNIHVNGYKRPPVKTIVLFGFDPYKKTIKMFVVDRIRSFEFQGKEFKPRWPVEFGSIKPKAAEKAKKESLQEDVLDILEMKAVEDFMKDLKTYKCTKCGFFGDASESAVLDCMMTCPQCGGLVKETKDYSRFTKVDATPAEAIVLAQKSKEIAPDLAKHYDLMIQHFERDSKDPEVKDLKMHFLLHPENGRIILNVSDKNGPVDPELKEGGEIDWGGIGELDTDLPFGARVGDKTQGLPAGHNFKEASGEFEKAIKAEFPDLEYDRNERSDEDFYANVYNFRPSPEMRDKVIAWIKDNMSKYNVYAFDANDPHGPEVWIEESKNKTLARSLVEGTIRT